MQPPHVKSAVALGRDQQSQHQQYAVCRCGNNGSNTDSAPFYPASYNAPNVVAVAATDNRDQIASFSNFGATSVDLGAPGVNVLSTTIGNTYSFFSGTSMATPHVSGAEALVLSVCSLDTAALKSNLLSNVDPITCAFWHHRHWRAA